MLFESIAFVTEYSIEMSTLRPFVNVHLGRYSVLLFRKTFFNVLDPIWQENC